MLCTGFSRDAGGYMIFKAKEGMRKRFTLKLDAEIMIWHLTGTALFTPFQASHPLVERSLYIERRLPIII